MKLAISNIGFAQPDEAQVYALMQRYGFTGLEAAPTRLVGEQPYQKCAEAARIAAALHAQYGFEIPSLQSIWFGQQGNLFVPEDAVRLASVTAGATEFAAAVGCPSLVFGCPKNRFVPQGSSPKNALAFFTKIAAEAQEKNCWIALEANPAIYGTNFCNTSAEAFAFAAEVPHLKVNYDVGTLLINNESLHVLADHFALVSHIHISEPQLAPIVRRSLHNELAALLKEKDYKGFVSIEMKTQPFAEIEPAMAAVAEVFA